MKAITHPKMTMKSNDPRPEIEADVLVAVQVEILIPIPPQDARQDGDGGLSFALSLLKDLPLRLGGCPVAARMMPEIA